MLQIRLDTPLTDFSVSRHFLSYLQYQATLYILSAVSFQTCFFFVFFFVDSVLHTSFPQNAIYPSEIQEHGKLR